LIDMTHSLTLYRSAILRGTALLGISGSLLFAASAQGLNNGAPTAACDGRIDVIRTQTLDNARMGEAERAAYEMTLQQAETFCASGNSALADRVLTALEERFGERAETKMTGTETTRQASTEPSRSPAAGLGEPRDDLERFHGLYELPDRPGRQLFVARARDANGEGDFPDGYIMIGAMWGDAANWYMVSQGDTSFEQGWVNGGMEPVTVSVETGPDGRATAMAIQSAFMDYDRMERVGDLPEGW
jgi:hypothetical protein